MAKVNPVGETWWRPLELFQKWENFGRGSERIPVTYAIVTASSKAKLFKSIGAVGSLNTWLPRSIFIYSNDTLLTAGCCKSKLRYLKHWYRLLVPVLWNQYSDIVSAEADMKRVHLSFKLRGLESKILARVLFLFRERTWERPLEPFWIPLCVSVHKSITYRWHEIKTSTIALAVGKETVIEILHRCFDFMLPVCDSFTDRDAERNSKKL